MVNRPGLHAVRAGEPGDGSSVSLASNQSRTVSNAARYRSVALSFRRNTMMVFRSRSLVIGNPVRISVSPKGMMNSSAGMLASDKSHSKKLPDITHLTLLLAYRTGSWGLVKWCLACGGLGDTREDVQCVVFAAKRHEQVVVVEP